jgi:curved DNA-binding protein CbpA
MTLYDLLGALPNDNAEGLRTAFRRAVKSAHPDLRPGDPEAAWKFRRIVRAHEILGDAEQRAAYDHLLDLAQIEETSANGLAAAIRIRKAASGVIATAGALAVTVGGFLLYLHMSAASVTPVGKTRTALQASAAIDPVPSPAATGTSSPIVSPQRAGTAVEAIEPNGIIPGTDAGTIARAGVGPGDDAAARDAGPSPARRSFGHRGKPVVASAEQASPPDPKSSPAETGATFTRLRKFDRAFADVAPAKSIEMPERASAASAMAGLPRLGPAATPRRLVPMPRRRPVAQDPSQLENAALARLR